MTIPSWKPWWAVIWTTPKSILPRRNGKSGSRPSSELYFYDGNDASQRSFTLDFEPRFCTVYALEMPPSVNDMSTPSVSLCYHAAAGQDGKATVGIALSGKTLTVYNDPDLSMAQTRRKLNAQGISYVCQLFR